jgi:hypothetical protein
LPTISIKSAIERHAAATPVNPAADSDGAAGRRLDPSSFGNDPDGMHDAGDIAKQGEQNIDPELQADANLKKDSEGRKYDCHQNSDDVHICFSSYSVFNQSFYPNAENKPKLFFLFGKGR